MKPSDLDLIRRSKDGDLDAFNGLVERYQGQVFNVAIRILGSGASADDATQETFIAAYGAIGKFRGDNIRAWLLRIAKNKCYDMMRSMRRRPADSLDDMPYEPTSTAASANPTPEEEAMRGELAAAIQRAIMSLPRDQRAVVVFVDVQGLSYGEAAEAAGVSIGTVKSRLSRGRRTVRDYLRERGGELLPPEFRQTG